MSAILIIMLAGFMNGTYAFPIKYMTRWNDENIWLVFSPIAFVLMPWICLPMLSKQVIPLIIDMPHSILSMLLLSGFLFGIGMIVFTYSLKFVGLGVSFVLNISSSTVFAALLPIIVMQPKKLISLFGVVEIFALLLFCVAVLASYFASKYKNYGDQVKQLNQSDKHVFIGVILGAMSGILTSAQGFAYAYSTTALKAKFFDYSNAAITNSPWIPIFSAAFIPYFSYFMFRSIQSKSIKKIISIKAPSYFLLCFLMGVLYFSSLLVFSRASLSLGNMSVVIAWPMLMIFIILTSNMWSLLQKEWVNADAIAFRYLLISIFTLILAIFSLTFAGYINS